MAAPEDFVSYDDSLKTPIDLDSEVGQIAVEVVAGAMMKLIHERIYGNAEDTNTSDNAAA